jgi:hypothetical protein
MVDVNKERHHLTQSQQQRYPLEPDVVVPDVVVAILPPLNDDAYHLYCRSFVIYIPRMVSITYNVYHLEYLSFYITPHTYTYDCVSLRVSH